MTEQSSSSGPAALPATTPRVWAPSVEGASPDAASRLRRIAARLAGDPEALDLLGDVDAVARELAERRAVEDRYTFLSEASELLASPGDIESTLRRVARLAVPRVADMCLIFVLDERGEVWHTVAQHVNPARQALLERLARELARERQAGNGGSRAASMASGRPMLLIDSNAELFETSAGGAVGSLVQALAPCSSMTVPLRARGRELGMVSLHMADSGRRFSGEDVDTVRELGERASLAIENARLFREREEAHTLLDTLFRSTPVGLALLDRELRFVRVNDALCTLTGHATAELVGHTVREVDPQLAPQLAVAARRLLDGGEPSLSLVVTAAPAGRSTAGHYAVTLFPVRGPEGEHLGLGASVADVTAHKQAELDAVAATRAAEAASHAKSQFLSVISHELRTPLTTVIGYADILFAGTSGPINVRQREQLSRIRTSAWHLVGIIEEILLFSRAEAGRESVLPELTDVAALVRETAEMIEPQARAKGLRFRIRGIDEPLPVVTDGGKVRQILLNLLGNAVKFTERGGVTLEMHRKPDEWVVVRVRDTGPGIAPEDRETIFEPFRQLDQSATRRKGGTGLGLALSRRLGRLLGGDVVLRSRPGRGSVFVLRLPPRCPQSADSISNMAVPSGA